MSVDRTLKHICKLKKNTENNNEGISDKLAPFHTVSNLSYNGNQLQTGN